MPLNSLESLRIVEHAATILRTAGVPLPEAVTAVQAVGQLTTGAVLLEAFWREWAAAGGEIHLSPPMLPHPELPVLSEAAAAADFLTPEQVFELGLDAVIGRLEPLAKRAAKKTPPEEQRATKGASG
jgi:hypothetical protein